MRVWHIPARLATGAFILNSGLAKLKEADQEHHKQVHGFASSAYPAFESMDPTMFTKALGAGEVALGGALLLPFVSSGLAGAGLTAFSGGLRGLYMRTPSMHEQGSVRPTPEGLAVAKDSWLLAIGTGLVLDSIATRGRRVARRSARRSAKAAGRVAVEGGKLAAKGGASAARGGKAAARNAKVAEEVAARYVDRAGQVAGRYADRAGDVAGRYADRAGDVAGRYADRAEKVAVRRGKAASDAVAHSVARGRELLAHS